MKSPLTDAFLLIAGQDSFLLVTKAPRRFSLCIETSAEEFCQNVEEGDLIVVSAPEGGPFEPALMLAELVRTYTSPLLVLPKDHPGSRRLSCVVSVGPEILTSCAIRRGTHPEQHLICSSDKLGGITIRTVPGGVEISPLPSGITVRSMYLEMSVVFSGS